MSHDGDHALHGFPGGLPHGTPFQREHDGRRFETLAIHAGQEPDPLTGAVNVPIYQTSTYAQDGVGEMRGGHDYARTINPTRTALEACLAALEEARHGVAFASGIGGVTAFGAEAIAWSLGDHAWPVLALALASIALAGGPTLRA
mgnify:CR=1 FL=1